MLTLKSLMEYSFSLCTHSAVHLSFILWWKQETCVLAFHYCLVHYRAESSMLRLHHFDQISFENLRPYHFGLFSFYLSAVVYELIDAFKAL